MQRSRQTKKYILLQDGAMYVQPVTSDAFAHLLPSESRVSELRLLMLLYKTLKADSFEQNTYCEFLF
jgi:hypothetical protein